MAVSEKQVPKYLSYAAIAASVIACGALWVAGSSNPRAYTSNMAVNHHATYGGALPCYACHVPQGGQLGMSTSLTCLTSGCHGELAPGVSRDEAINLFAASEKVSYRPDKQVVAENHVTNHANFNKWSCWECHTEHTTKETVAPKGWKRLNAAGPEQASAPDTPWISVKTALATAPGSPGEPNS
jgi:hypothetical protein